MELQRSLLGDYKKEFEEKVSSLIDLKIEDRELRMKEVEYLIDEYITTYGEKPNNYQIERLTNYILSEEIKDKNPHKMKHGNAILSDKQEKRRHNREVAYEQLSGMIDGDKKIVKRPTRPTGRDLTL